MKKKIFAAAIMVMALAASAPVFAQKNDCKAKQVCTETTCAAGDKVKKAQNPFEGLNLTADQKTKLDALRQQCAADRKQAKEQAKERKDRDRKDRMESYRQMRADRLAKIKNILTPEQYMKFLENQYVDARQSLNKVERSDRKAFRSDVRKMRRDAKDIRRDVRKQASGTQEGK